MQTSAQPDKQPSYAWVGNVGLWVISLFIVVAGLILAAGAAPGPWWNEVVTGVLMAAGAMLLIPPVLQKLRDRWPRLRRRWVPVAWCVVLLIVPPIAGIPFKPTATELAALREQALQDARDLYAAGDLRSARAKIHRFDETADRNGEVASLLRQIARAQEVRAAGKGEKPRPPSSAATQVAPAAFPDPAALYVERVEEYWLREVQSLPTAAPAGGPEFGALLTRLEYFRSLVADGEALSLNTKQKAVHERLKEALRAKQRTLYPTIRRQYAQMLRTQLFRRDVEVTAAGDRARILRLTGPIFVRNANIEDLQQELTRVLARMRFGRTEYGWSRESGVEYHYDLKSADDGDLAVR